MANNLSPKIAGKFQNPEIEVQTEYFENRVNAEKFENPINLKPSKALKNFASFRKSKIFKTSNTSEYPENN